jgi:hypothetical protein
MAGDDPILVQHPLSKRSAVFDDDGTSAWLYLTAPNTVDADAEDIYTTPGLPEVSFLWSKSGNDVAVCINGLVLAFISAQLSAGYSRLVLQNGPWGRVWNDAIYESLFDQSDSRA